MTKRLLMQAYGKVRPLSFDREGQNKPLLASASTPWGGLPFEVHELPEVDGPWDGGPIPGERGILIPIEGKREMVFELGKREITLPILPGCIGFSEGSHVISAKRSHGHGTAIAFNVTPVWYGRMLAEGGPASFARLPTLAASETVRMLVAAICAEVRSGAASGTMFAETLSLTLIHYAIERMAPTPMRVRGGFSDGQQRRLLRYMDERLQTNLSLSELAAFTGLRQRQFTALFHSAFGVSPYRFLIERRLEQGARLLAHSDAEIAEIALQVGFSSQSHFSEAFRRRFGTTPRNYALSRRFRAARSR